MRSTRCAVLCCAVYLSAARRVGGSRRPPPTAPSSAIHSWGSEQGRVRQEGFGPDTFIKTLHQGRRGRWGGQRAKRAGIATSAVLPARAPPASHRPRSGCSLGSCRLPAWPGQDARHSTHCTWMQCGREGLLPRRAVLRMLRSDAGAGRQDAVRLVRGHVAAAVLELLEVLLAGEKPGGHQLVSKAKARPREKRR